MEEEINYDSQTMNIPRRRRWYTHLWRSCLGLRCMHPQKKKKYPLYLIGYDPIGPLQRAASVGDLDTTEKLIHSSQHHVDEGGGTCQEYSEPSREKNFQDYILMEERWHA